MVLLIFNFGFYRTPDFIEDESGNWNEDVYEQLQFLKYYLFGQLPVADAFIAWSNSLEQEEGQFPSGPIPWTIHVLSLAICLLLSWLAWKI